MSQSEVFRPSNGELITRPGPVHEGYIGSMDTFRKTRPSTQGGSRFGVLSQNSFFTRHNPHPARVRHIKGLLDVPICAVNDDGYFANPKYSLQFPPNNFNKEKLANQRIPVNAINVNSQLHPINTITGLQYFTGLNSYPWREKAVPKVGLVPVTERWRDELKHLTEAIGLPEQQEKPQQPKELERPRTQYSEKTGRLIPPPSRAMSRGQSRGQSRGGQPMPNLQHIAAEPDMESMVLSMLCQILQTEDINSVQAWLCSASEREKALVQDFIKAAVVSKEDYYKRDVPVEFIENDNKTKLPPINENSQLVQQATGDVDRLVLEENKPPVISGTLADDFIPDPFGVLDEFYPADTLKPPTSDPFKKPATRCGSRMRTPLKTTGPSTNGIKPDQAITLRYTNSAKGKRENGFEHQIQETVEPTFQPSSPNTF